MLKLKHKHHLDFPHIVLSPLSPMKLSPVTADDDELSQAIDNELDNQDDNWQLVERPDSSELNKFWSDVEHDVMNDPEWFNFADREE